MSPIRLETKLDPIALAALIFSLASVVYSFFIFVRGADLELMPPEQIMIRAEQYRSGRKLALFSTRVSCLNRGKPGYPGVIQWATLSAKFGKERIEHQWQDFGYAQEDHGVLKLQRNEDAHPLGIEGGGLVSKEVFFYPRTTSSGGDSNFITWDDFMNRLAGLNHLDFYLTIRVFDEPSQTKVCRVIITDQLRRRLKEGEWSAPACLRVEQLQDGS